jgi:uroporphyrinogen decarboxylase
MFDLVQDYPVQALNWHDRETPPTLQEGLERFNGAVLGGIGRIEALVQGSPDQIQTEAAEAIAQTGGRRFILGTGCVTPIITPTANIRAVREAVEHTTRMTNNE